MLGVLSVGVGSIEVLGRLGRGALKGRLGRREKGSPRFRSGLFLGMKREERDGLEARPTGR